MFRRAVALPALIVVAAMVFGACGIGSGPALTDPKEIVAGAVTAMEAAKSVHLEATVEGTLTADLTGSGKATEMNVAGTSLTADLDLANKNAHISAAVPAFLGLTADIVVLGSETYTKISLVGEKYEKTPTVAGQPTDPTVALSEVTSFLSRPEVRPVKGDDASCGTTTCYQVELSLSAADLETLLPDQDLEGATILTTILIEQNTLYPVSATVVLSGATIGEITLTLTMSSWDKPVSISAPPADQVD